ncbi:MAG TPA: hypothetical protein DCK83_08650 [Gallionellaceae bacterium]|nr:hypothetical protein [Gallionellaceae bacterium]
MMRRRYLALLLLAVLALLWWLTPHRAGGGTEGCAWICITWTPAPPTATPVPPTGTPAALSPAAVPVGYGAFFLGNEPAASYRAIADLGADWAAVRWVCDDLAACPVAWLDEMVSRATDAGLQVIVIWWVGEDGLPNGDCGKPVDLSALKKVAEELASRYAGRVQAWAYGWEVDGCAMALTWSRTQQWFYDGVKAGNPGAEVVLGLAYERFQPAGPFYQGFLPVMSTMLTRPAFDVVAFSGFDDFRAAWSPPGIEGKALAMRDMLRRSRIVADVAMVGGGLPSGPSDQWTLRSDALQAEGIRRILVECAKAGVRWCVLYRASDDTGDGADYGLLRADGSAKPAAGAFAETVGRLRAGESVPVVPGRDRMGKR